MNLSLPYLAPILLSTLVAISLVATAVQRARRGKLRRNLRAVASEWRMTYASNDRLRLAERIHNRLPIPGTAALTVCDVIYGARAGVHRCVFTVQFTTGVIRANKRVQRVAFLSESRDPRAAPDLAFSLASEELPLIEQYRSLDPRAAQKESSAPVDAEPPEN